MQDQIITIRTLDCDICNRYDSIMLSLEEIAIRTKATDMGVGAYSIIHNDHTRIIYFDVEGNYLGDTIALSQEEIPDMLKTHPIPFYLSSEKSSKWILRLKKKIISKFHTKEITISVAGPSRAGKTSIVRYLETLTPESGSTSIISVPTMGKSIKRIKLGKTMIKTFDLGGQKDFWHLWENTISKSDIIFFILDATSNNILEIAKAFEKVIHSRKINTPVLVILNKKDLILRGEAQNFLSSGEFLSLTNLKLPIPNVLAIEASIFEGIAYITSTYEELPLIELISSFMDQHC